MISTLASQPQRIGRSGGSAREILHSVQNVEGANRSRRLVCDICESDRVAADPPRSAGQFGLAQVCHWHGEQFCRQGHYRAGRMINHRRGSGLVAELEDLQHRNLPIDNRSAQFNGVQAHLGLTLQLLSASKPVLERDVGEPRQYRDYASYGLKPVRVEPSGYGLEGRHHERTSSTRRTVTERRFVGGSA